MNKTYLSTIETEINGSKKAYIILNRITGSPPYEAIETIGVLTLDLRNPNTVWGQDLFVKESERGNDYGFALITKAKDWARAHEYKYHWFGCDATNDSLIAYYERLGFIPIGEYENGAWLAFAPPPDPDGHYCQYLEFMASHKGAIDPKKARRYLCYSPGVIKVDDENREFKLCQKHFAHLTGTE